MSQTGVNEQPNPAELDANNPDQIHMMHQRFPELTHQEIIQAIQTQGPNESDVVLYLNQRLADKDPGRAE